MKENIVETGFYKVYRDKDLIGVGLSKKQAETLVVENSIAYPANVFSIVPGGDVVPGNKEKKS